MVIRTLLRVVSPNSSTFTRHVSFRFLGRAPPKKEWKKTARNIVISDMLPSPPLLPSPPRPASQPAGRPPAANQVSHLLESQATVLGVHVEGSQSQPMGASRPPVSRLHGNEEKQNKAERNKKQNNIKQNETKRAKKKKKTKNEKRKRNET